MLLGDNNSQDFEMLFLIGFWYVPYQQNAVYSCKKITLSDDDTFKSIWNQLTNIKCISYRNEKLLGVICDRNSETQFTYSL